MFSCEFYEIFRKAFFKEHLWWSKHFSSTRWKISWNLLTCWNCSTHQNWTKLDSCHQKLNVRVTSRVAERPKTYCLMKRGIPVDIARQFNVHKTFRRRPGRLLNVLCTFSLRPVSTGRLRVECRYSPVPNLTPKTKLLAKALESKALKSFTLLKLIFWATEVWQIAKSLKVLFCNFY